MSVNRRIPLTGEMLALGWVLKWSMWPEWVTEGKDSLWPTGIPITAIVWLACGWSAVGQVVLGKAIKETI